MNNLFISYDLHAPEKNYERVIATIKTLGSWARVHKSVWYVKSPFDVDQAIAKVRSAIDANDSLAVIDATNRSMRYYNLNPEVGQALEQNWQK